MKQRSIAAGLASMAIILVATFQNCSPGFKAANGADLASSSSVEIPIGTATPIPTATPPGATPTPAQPKIGPVLQVVSGRTTCALMREGTVKCLGSGVNGSLGNGATADSLKPVFVSNISDAVAITHSCALLKSGKIKCWGSKNYGQLGDGSPVPNFGTAGFSSVPVDVIGISNAVSISGGEDGTCALLSTGKVMCWGWNYTSAQTTGGGGIPYSNIPLEVPGLSDAVLLSTDPKYGTSACAVVKTGRVLCWGHNFGIGAISAGGPTTATAIEIPGVSNAVKVYTGYFMSCATSQLGETKCWGTDFYWNGVLTGLNPKSFTTFSPQTFSLLTEVASMGISYYSVPVLFSNGEVKEWDSNFDGSPTSDPFGLVDLSSLKNIIQVSANVIGGGCGLQSDGTVWCWGNNSFGQLGTSTPSYSKVPIKIDF
jgi:alpha-tubulin suppressor-like RCC1 family protein